MNLIQIAVKEVESLSSRQAGSSAFRIITESPLATQRGGVTGGLQNLSDRHVFRTQRLFRHILATGVASHVSMPHVLAGHQNTSRGGTNRVAGVEICELHSLSRHLIQPRCSDDLLSVTTKIAVAKIVSENENDVWLGGVGQRRRRRSDDEEESR